MKLRLFSLNIEKGRFLDKVIRYLKENPVDIIHLQEVAGGGMQKDKRDCFEDLVTQLPYRGELGIYVRKTGRPDTYVGNATLYNFSFNLKDSQVVWLKDFREVDDTASVNWETASRNALVLILVRNGKTFVAINTHLPWSPTPGDTPEKLAQGRKLLDFVKSVRLPFLLSGDFNVNRQSGTVSELSMLARNLTVEAGITNTLDLKLHRAKNLPPLGLTVDYAFVSKDIKTASITVLKNEHLSDHQGQVIEVEF